MKHTDDQDLGDWKAERNRKAAKQLADKLSRRQRDEWDDILSRYGRELPPIDDSEAPPRID
jgi:hypothetical protein